MTLSRRILIVLVAAVLAVAGAASGQGTPVAAGSTAVLNAGVPAVSMFVVPAGFGSQLVACYGPGGITTSATIDVTLFDATGLPVAGVPNTDVRIAEIGSIMAWCHNSTFPPQHHGPNFADGPSNAMGQTQFSMAYYGGGNQFGGCRVFVLEASGQYAAIPTVLPVHMNSPDLNGDLLINLADIVLFAQDIGAPTPPYRSDFNWDGQINLSDYAMFAQSMGANCP